MIGLNDPQEMSRILVIFGTVGQVSDSDRLEGDGDLLTWGGD